MGQHDESETTAMPAMQCPRCGLPAWIADRFTLDGAPEAVEHVKLVCAARHWFTPPIDELTDYESRRPAERLAGRDRVSAIAHPMVPRYDRNNVAILGFSGTLSQMCA